MSDSCNQNKGERRAVFVLLVITIIAFHVATVLLLRWYYRTHLPHYDSIGSYTIMARVAHVTRGEGLAAGLDCAQGWPLSWLQSMFAVAAAWLVSPTPAGFQLLNTLCFAVFLVSVYQAACGLGGSRIKAFLSALVIVLPESLLGWDGGYQDMRREAAFLSLFGASFFLLLAQFWSPTRGRAVALGLSAGFCVWSRGSALPYLIVVLGPLVLAGLVIAHRAGRLREHLRWVGLAACCFVPVASVYLYGTLSEVIARESNPLLCYGRTGDRWESLSYYVRAPFVLWSTREPGAGLHPWSFHYGLLAGAALVAAALALLGGGVRREALLQPRRAAALAAGAWAFVATLGLICLVVRWEPYFGYSGMMPFYSTLLFPLSMALAALSTIEVMPAADRCRRNLRWLGAALIALSSIGMMGHRMWLRARPSEPASLATAMRLTDRIRSENSGATIAFLSHDLINFDTLAYLEARKGYASNNHLRKLRWELPSGELFDSAAVLPADTDVPATQALMLRQILEKSDFIVVNGDLNHYRSPPVWNFFLFRHGAPIVERLLADEDLEQVLTYKLGRGPESQRFVVLRNPHRREACLP